MDKPTQHNFKNRDEKIKFLKGLSSGKRTLDEIAGESGAEVWFENEQGSYEGGKNSVYEGGDGNGFIVLTRDEYEAHQAKHPRKTFITLVEARSER